MSSKTILALLVTIGISGCSPLYYDWDRGAMTNGPDAIQESNFTAPPARKTSVQVPRKQTASGHPKKHKQPVDPLEMKEMSIQPAPDTAPPPASSTISMIAPDDASGAAAKSLDATGQRLARFDRSRLSGATLVTYDQANRFLNQGKQALAENDSVAASGFAHKASVLADRVRTSAAR